MRLTQRKIDMLLQLRRLLRRCEQTILLEQPGQRDCADPQPSAFPSDTVVIALVERVFTETPEIARYFQRASLPLDEMNDLLAQLNASGTTIEAIADRFVSERAALWRGWVDASL